MEGDMILKNCCGAAFNHRRGCPNYREPVEKPLRNNRVEEMYGQIFQSDLTAGPHTEYADGVKDTLEWMLNILSAGDFLLMFRRKNEMSKVMETIEEETTDAI